jgi:hypothetical protein
MIVIFLDSGCHRNDDGGVTPVKTGVQARSRYWIPAFAGMTKRGVHRNDGVGVVTPVKTGVQGKACELDTGFHRYDIVGNPPG